MLELAELQLATLQFTAVRGVAASDVVALTYNNGGVVDRNATTLPCSDGGVVARDVATLRCIHKFILFYFLNDS
jgi:hypothetical protein